ncbi:DUF2637 domain-containing protein [Streptomyces sp. ODS28]|uniref:DUF2637 domain-containing protein n=1 Tax=Streptomyces sp. ODS28 TaxID=3136688 RepID=UPI0031E7054A
MPLTGEFRDAVPQGEVDPADEVLNLDDELTVLLAASAEPAPGIPSQSRGQPQSHRRPPRLLSKENWLKTTSFVLACLTTLVVISVSIFGAVVSYGRLEEAASEASTPGVAECWPLLLFAPWLVAYFTILRATLHRKRALRAWALVVLCAALAVGLCVSEAPKTLVGVAVAALPPLAALACFSQYMGQLALTRPPQSRRSNAAHRPRSAQGNGGAKVL